MFAREIAELTPIPLFIQRSAGWRNLSLQLQLVTMILGALSFLVPIVWTVAARFRDRTEPPDGNEKVKPRKNRRSKKRASSTGFDASSGSEPTWRLSLFRLFLFAAFSALSWKATRNSHQFAAVVGAVTAWNFGEWAGAVAHRRSATSKPGARATSPAAPLIPRLATLAVVVIVLVLVASGTFYSWSGEGRTIGLGEEPLWFPHAAIECAGEKSMPPRFLSYHDGYAALYEYHNGPERKVFSDARLEVIGPELYERYVNLRNRIHDDDPSWPSALDALGRPAVLIGHENSAMLGASIMANPSWRCVWFDPIAALFVHRSYSEAVAAHEVDLARRHFIPDPAFEPGGIPALRANARALWTYANVFQGRGRSDLAHGPVLLGLDQARRIRRADPGNLDGWKLVGQLEMVREPAELTPSVSSPEATAAVPRYRLELDPVLDLSPIRATYALEKAAEIAPRDFLTLLLLEKQFEAQGDDRGRDPGPRSDGPSGAD